MKTRVGIILFILLINNFSYSQYYRERDKFKIGANASIDLSYRWLINNYPDKPSKTDDFIENRNLSEKPLFTYSYGVLIEYQILKNFSIKTEAKYYLKGLSTIRLGLSNEFSIGTDEEYLFYKHQYGFIEVPISANLYYLNRPKQSYFVNLGVSYNYLIFGKWNSRYKAVGSDEEKTHEQYLKRQDLKNNEFNINNIGVQLSTGIDFRIKRQNTIRAEVFASSFILPKDKTYLSEYFYNYGIRLNYLFSFK